MKIVIIMCIMCSTRLQREYNALMVVHLTQTSQLDPVILFSEKRKDVNVPF